MSEPVIRLSILFLSTALLLIPDKVLGAVITVNSLGDSGTAVKACELRSAILAANTDAIVDGCSSGSAADVIEFSMAGTIAISSDLPEITDDLQVNGPGHNRLIIDGSGRFRQFKFAAFSGDNAIRNLTLLRGKSADSGGCVRTGANSLLIEDTVWSQCHSDGSGGALYASGDTTILRNYFIDNEASGNGGAVIYVADTHQVTDSTFRSNSCVGVTSNGGAITVVNATATVLRSTFSDNSANLGGGAIASISLTGSLTVASSTISGNRADDDDSGTGNGGGILLLQSSLILGNTIISGNSDLSASSKQPDIAIAAAVAVVSNGFNLIGINQGATTDFPEGSPNAFDDYVGTSGTPIDALLNVLGDYGGPTLTMPPMDSSVVIDKGSCPGELIDQRGFSNPDTGLRILDFLPDNASDGCDIGAVELLVNNIFTDSFEFTLE